jgi:hypothetical protein
VMWLAPGSVTCAEVSSMTGPAALAWAAQPAAMQAPMTATRLAAALPVRLQTLTLLETLWPRKRLWPRAATGPERIGADLGVRGDGGIPGMMMTDLTCVCRSYGLTPGNRAAARGYVGSACRCLPVARPMAATTRCLLPG